MAFSGAVLHVLAYGIAVLGHLSIRVEAKRLIHPLIGTHTLSFNSRTTASLHERPN